MRHRNYGFKIGRGSAHRRTMIANLLKALVVHNRIQTTLTKAKELRRHADQLISLAKSGTLAARRRANALMMVSYNRLAPKQARQVKRGDLTPYNDDRKVSGRLFEDLGPRFATRSGGYTRILKLGPRRGDSASLCRIEYLES